MADIDSLFPEDIIEDDDLVYDEDIYEDDEEDSEEDEQEDEIVVYDPSVFFDFKKGDFSVMPNGSFKEATGYEAWEQWCIKTMVTQRYVHDSYSDDYGVDIESAIQSDSHEEAENILNREITEALTSDPRTLSVDDIEFTWDDDSVNCKVVITGIYGDAIVEAELTG